MTVHSLRVTALTTAREWGADIIDLQDFAGHADPRTTLTYIRSHDRLAANILTLYDNIRRDLGGEVAATRTTMPWVSQTYHPASRGFILNQEDIADDDLLHSSQNP